MKRIATYLGPDSPWGPVAGGVALSVVIITGTILVSPLVLVAARWWFSLWLL